MAWRHWNDGGVSRTRRQTTAPLRPRTSGRVAIRPRLPGVGNQYKPAELGKAEWDTVRESPPWAVDAWGLGCLIQEICSCTSMKSVEDLRCGGQGVVHSPDGCVGPICCFAWPHRVPVAPLPASRRTDVIPAALLGDYQKLLSSAPTRRLNPSKVWTLQCVNV